MNKRPNILIFQTDQQQNAVTYPDHMCRTPNIERLANEGVRFNYTFTPMAHCCPSRASFFTGLFPSQHGVHNNVLNGQALSRGLKKGTEVFSEKLKEAGYSLHYTGKWHVSAEEDPASRGFEELHVTCRKDDFHGVKPEIFKNPGKEIDNCERERGEILRPGWGSVKMYGASEWEYQSDPDYKVVSTALEKLDELKNAENPWLLYVGVIGPHDPYILPKEYAGMYSPENIALPENYFDDLQDKPAIYSRMRKRFSQLTECEVREAIAHYYGYCTMIDRMFGEILDKLDEHNMSEDTLVLFISDHGDMAGAHGLFCKGIAPYDEGYRVPCVIRYPHGIKNPGREIDALISMMDFAPTFTELADSNRLKKCAGRSLVPFLKDEEPIDWRNAVYNQCNGVEIYYTQRFVRTKKYKLVYNPADIDELYDIECDPHELTNLIDRLEYEKIKLELFQKLWQNAFETDDGAINPYITVAQAEYGPACINRKKHEMEHE